VYIKRASVGVMKEKFNIKVHWRQRSAAHGHEPWNGQRSIQTPIITTNDASFCHLIPCAIWWRHLRTYAA